MSNDDRIVELLSDILIEQKGMRADMHDMRGDIQKLQQSEVRTTTAIERLEEMQAKTNLALGELRLSVMRLADDIVRITQHEGRIVRLEAEVFKR